MQFRRSGQRDDRRRRVYCDTLVGGSETKSGSNRARSGGASDKSLESGVSANYGDAAFMHEQPRVTDLIPVRLSVFVAIFLAGLVVVAGLEALYFWMPQLAASTSDGGVAAFDLDAEGGLAVWFSSMTLALAGVLAILVYSVRRHRKDDYPGHYRVWLWAMSCCFLLSIDETSSLHEGFKEMMVLLTGARLAGDGSIWWVAAYGFLLGGVGTRLLVDMRTCWLSSTAFVLTACCYALAVATQLEWVMPRAGARAVMLEEGAEMIGNMMLLMTIGLYARHVILDAQGLLPQTDDLHALPDEEASEPSPTRSSKSDRSVAVHPPQGVPRPARTPAKTVRKKTKNKEEPETVPSPTAARGAQRKSVSAAPAPQPRRPAASAQPEPKQKSGAKVECESDSEAGSDSGATDDTAQRKLSKSERKALRRKLRKMRADREERQNQ